MSNPTTQPTRTPRIVAIIGKAILYASILSLMGWGICVGRNYIQLWSWPYAINFMLSLRLVYFCLWLGFTWLTIKMFCHMLSDIIISLRKAL